MEDPSAFSFESWRKTCGDEPRLNLAHGVYSHEAAGRYPSKWKVILDIEVGSLMGLTTVWERCRMLLGRIESTN